MSLYRFVSTCALALFANAVPAFAQGAGPGIDPTPISSLPFTITVPGTYYLTVDLTGVSRQHGIIGVEVSEDQTGAQQRSHAGAHRAVTIDDPHAAVVDPLSRPTGWRVGAWKESRRIAERVPETVNSKM